MIERLARQGRAEQGRAGQGRAGQGYRTCWTISIVFCQTKAMRKSNNLAQK